MTPIRQTNFYIDSPNRIMKQEKSSLRIRTLPKGAELTLKTAARVGNQEYNQALTSLEADVLIQTFILPDGPIKEMLLERKIPIDQLAIWGHLTTVRREKQTSIGLMALDENHYEDQIDYELELEVEDAISGKKDFEQFLQKENIHFKYASSKVARLASKLANHHPTKTLSK
ncbi:Adenylate cyclase [Streptococcus sp. DD13]|nr:Adenylate cyclase [Streptococcus sp. DD13]